MRRKLLVVDDEDAIRFAFRDYFTSRAFEVDCVESIEEAQAFLNDFQYGVVISDLRLGGEGYEGLEIAGHVREYHPGTAVIILTAFGSAEAENVARRVGVAEFLHKPQPLRMMAEIIDGLLRDEPAGSRGPRNPR
jgi:DNA-binding NtrC family response regulator